LVFNYSTLPRAFPRKFVPATFRFEWPELDSLYATLEKRPIGTTADIEKWLADEGELDAVIGEQRSLRYVNYSRQTDNNEYEKAYTEYIEVIEPKLKLANFKLLEKFLASPKRSSLPEEYQMTVKRRTNELEIFREENVDLEKKDASLGQEYQRVMGAMTVMYKGEERTLQQMIKFEEETDRDVRKEAWELSSARALKDSPTIEGIYGKMVEIRHKVARNAGFANYRDYIFRKKERFDYTPDDCIRFHSAVEDYFVPLSREIDRERKEKLGLDELRPWDLRVDVEGRPPLSPFRTSEELVDGCSRIIGEVDEQLHGFFRKMADLDLLDLQSRKGKAPGGFQEDFSEVKLPFIFMNAAGRDNDVRTLLHESGHSFHTFLMREHDLPYFNSGANLPLEFAEVASTSIELIGSGHMRGSFYGEEEARRSNRAEVASTIKLFTWVATIDAFQHWVYTHPEALAEERVEEWVKTFRRFAGSEEWDGYSEHLRYRWQRQLHLFEVPFYYIEYGIANLGALGIWFHYRREPAEAIRAYKAALSLGSSKPLPELFQAAGVPWDMGPGIVRKYAAELKSVLQEYS
jgi:oligoendopeptidase F